MEKKLRIPCKSNGGSLPVYQSRSAAGADLRSAFTEDIYLQPGDRVMIPTGISLEIPEGYEGQVRPRSGLAAKHGITVLNSPGTIDSDYRGEIKIILINLGNEAFLIRRGDRIAQLVIAPVLQADFVLQDELRETGRGDGGFGSTGIAE